MANINVNRGRFISQTSEIIGYKSGLALTLSEFSEIIPKRFIALWEGSRNESIRFRAEEYEELIAHLLYELGNTRTPDFLPHTSLSVHYLRKEPEKLELYMEISKAWTDFLTQFLKNPENHKTKIIDPEPFIVEMKVEYGWDGFEIACKLAFSTSDQLHRSPWAKVRHVEWSDTTALQSLFKSRSLETQHGVYFDQRFIDYLSQHSERIGQIHWRKFEGLTCEFFEKQGYFVEIGPGSNDGGIDARAWRKDPKGGSSPTFLIQCKRRKEKIDQMVIKALYYDVEVENAEAGLIVTSNMLSPSAEQLLTAREHPIEKADRETLKKWLHIMRTPWKGTFMY
ncbi:MULTISPECIES: restriction endonuclease [Paenibacillus]|uniref:restriction endonuclease n=1 Tax=Paenibacillus TaxID=44249 RepID=UPI00300B0AE5